MREHRARGVAMRRSCQCVTLMLAIVAHARDSRAAWCDPRSEIQSLFDRVAAAIGRKDIDGVAEYVLPTARLEVEGRGRRRRCGMEGADARCLG